MAQGNGASELGANPSVQLEDEFGDIIRKARTGLGLPLEEAARRAGLDAPRLAELESYAQAPDRSVSDALSQALGLGAEQLWAIAAGRYAPGAVSAPAGLQVRTFTFTAMNANGYVAAGPGGEAFIVDPGGDGDRLLEAVQAEGWRLTAVLITHTHADHVADLEKVCRDRRVPVFVSPEGLGALPPGIGAEGAADGRILRLGEGLAIRVMATPGHSPDGLCFVVEPEEGGAGCAFVGDTLFAGSLGGPHRGSEGYARLLASARRIMELPPETVLFPGHGPPTRVADERRWNPFLAS